MLTRANHTRGHRLPIHPFSQEELDQTARELAKGDVDYEATKREYVFKIEVDNAIAHIHDRVDELQVETLSQPPIAYQSVQITAAMLASSDDPEDVAVERSVLTTVSETVNEFNWMRSGGLRGYRVVTGPGDGVVTHHVIIDQQDANLQMLRWKATDGDYTATESVVCRPYGMTGLRLQFGTYRPDGDALKFWPVSLTVGVHIYLSQTLPMEDFA